MTAMASQIISLTHVYSTVYSRRRSKKTSKLRVSSICAGNSSGTSEFSAQRASNAENVSIWRRHHVVQLMMGWYQLGSRNASQAACHTRSLEDNLQSPTNHMATAIMTIIIALPSSLWQSLLPLSSSLWQSTLPLSSSLWQSSLSLPFHHSHPHSHPYHHHHHYQHHYWIIYNYVCCSCAFHYTRSLLIYVIRSTSPPWFLDPDSISMG